MATKVKFPLRFKILVAQLLVVTVVLSLITFTMANLFHDDKTAYIHDLTSTMVLHASEEANELLAGYRERLRLFSRILAEPETASREKVLQGLFEEFGDVVMVTRSSGSGEETIYDEGSLTAAGLTSDQILTYREAHPLRGPDPGELYVENSTISTRLPCITAAVSDPPQGGEKAVTWGLIRLDKLQRLAHRSRVFETFLLDRQGRYLAHTDSTKEGKQPEPGWWGRVSGVRAPGMTMEYEQKGRRMVGGFARTSCGGLTAGVQIPRSAAYLSSRELLRDLMALSLTLLGGGALLSLYWSHRLTRPIEALSKATRMVGQGHFEIQVEASSGDEIGALAGSFNTMAGELKSREKALKDLYGQLVQSEKMAAFGALGAGIAHEVKNPLAGILGITQLSLRGVEEGHPLEKNLRIIEKETKRCKTIIENLLRFARQEQVQFSRVEIPQVVADAIAIVDHQLGIHQIRVEKEIEPGLPTCRGNANQLQQVLMNLMINAQQAMAGEPGALRVRARRSEAGVELSVTDTGPGIAKDIQQKIFEPFFTTKPPGQGTGLGLSVTYGIVKEHGGEIRLESGEEGGTTFIVTIPAAAEAA